MFVSRPLVAAALFMEVRVMISTDSPSSLSPAARRAEIAAILAAGIVRLKSRAVLAILEQPEETPETCLEVPPESVLSVTNVVNNQ